MRVASERAGPTGARRTAEHVARWIGRVGSIGTLTLLILFAVGEGFDPGTLTRREWALMTCFPFGVALGLLIGWRRERLGGWLALGSLASFYALSAAFSGDLPRGPFFALLASPGVAYLIAAWLNRPTDI